MAVNQHPLTEIVLSLFMREGSAFAHDDAGIHRARINWELNSGQWVMMTDEKNRLLGLFTYYLVDDETLSTLHKLGAHELVHNNKIVDTRSGEHVYISSVVVSPWASRRIAYQLYKLVVAENPDAKTVSWNHRRPMEKNVTIRKLR